MTAILSKVVLAVVAAPLLMTFLAKGCDGQKSGASAQANNRNAQTAGAGASANEVNGGMEDAKTGTWGGQHIALEVTEQGARVEYDCGHGTIDQKIVADAGGRFDVRGTHVREHGGPVRRDETPNTHPARFQGQIKGDTMTLSVTETDTNQSIGTFTLVFGQPPHLMKCR